MIRAEGKKKGKKVVVEYENDIFTFNGKQNDLYMAELNVMLDAKLTLFGTYHAENSFDELNIAGVLREYFFDEWAKVECDPELDVGWTKGEVY